MSRANTPTRSARTRRGDTSASATQRAGNTKRSSAVSPKHPSTVTISPKITAFKTSWNKFAMREREKVYGGYIEGLRERFNTALARMRSKQQ
eukprot:1341787-Amorphochlora_amoeboformis.AAC.1